MFNSLKCYFLWLENGIGHPYFPAVLVGLLLFIMCLGLQMPLFPVQYSTLADWLFDIIKLLPVKSFSLLLVAMVLSNNVCFEGTPLISPVQVAKKCKLLLKDFNLVKLTSYGTEQISSFTWSAPPHGVIKNQL